MRIYIEQEKTEYMCVCMLVCVFVHSEVTVILNRGNAEWDAAQGKSMIIDKTSRMKCVDFLFFFLCF